MKRMLGASNPKWTAFYGNYGNNNRRSRRTARAREKDRLRRELHGLGQNGDT